MLSTKNILSCYCMPEVMVRHWEWKQISKRKWHVPPECMDARVPWAVYALKEGACTSKYHCSEASGGHLVLRWRNVRGLSLLAPSKGRTLIIDPFT